MLVLTRKIGERVVIADGIVVQVLEVSGRRIRLGVEVPPDVTIRRGELSVIPDQGPAWPGAAPKAR